MMEYVDQTSRKLVRLEKSVKSVSFGTLLLAYFCFQVKSFCY